MCKAEVRFLFLREGWWLVMRWLGWRGVNVVALND